MMRRSYPHTSDSTILAARRRAAVSRTIAAAVVMFGILAMFALPVHEEQHTDGAQAGFSAAMTTAASAVQPETPGASHFATDAQDDSRRFDSSETGEYPSTF